MDTATITLSTDFSLVALFLRADIVVKLVMLSLFASSIWSWAIIVEKYILFRRVEKASDHFETLFWSGKSLKEIQLASADDKSPMAHVFTLAMREWRRGKGTKQLALVERALALGTTESLRTLSRRMTFLATTGAVAPFVGLFGTVWGIMNSFQSIAVSRDTSLAVVAPGIAEALFATGLGLLAAIPAVVAYNAYVSRINRYGDRLVGFGDDIVLILKDNGTA